MVCPIIVSNANFLVLWIAQALGHHVIIVDAVCIRFDDYQGED